MLADETSGATRSGEEEQLRVHWYALLGRLLQAAPDAETLKAISRLRGDESDLGQAIGNLARAAGVADQGQIKREYHDLFIGVGQGELTPYASYYLTGFLNEKPLAKLRGDMRQLGIARADGKKEPEDHIASLCEMMSGLIGGAFGAPLDLASQRQFFETHIGSWAPRFFEDLEAAKSASFYMPVGTIGRHFMEIETQAFDMAA